jgi:hypothetical protein
MHCFGVRVTGSALHAHVNQGGLTNYSAGSCCSCFIIIVFRSLRRIRNSACVRRYIKCGIVHSNY